MIILQRQKTAFKSKLELFKAIKKRLVINTSRLLFYQSISSKRNAIKFKGRKPLLFAISVKFQ